MKKLDYPAEKEIRKKFKKFHKMHRFTDNCNVTWICMELNIGRMKFYRWLKDKSHLDMQQLEILKKYLTIIACFAIINLMIQYILYYTNSNTKLNSPDNRVFSIPTCVKNIGGFFIFV